MGFRGFAQTPVLLTGSVEDKAEAQRMRKALGLQKGRAATQHKSALF